MRIGFRLEGKKTRKSQKSKVKNEEKAAAQRVIEGLFLFSLQPTAYGL